MLTLSPTAVGPTWFKAIGRRRSRCSLRWMRSYPCGPFALASLLYKTLFLLFPQSPSHSLIDPHVTLVNPVSLPSLRSGSNLPLFHRSKRKVFIDFAGSPRDKLAVDSSLPFIFFLRPEVLQGYSINLPNYARIESDFFPCKHSVQLLGSFVSFNPFFRGLF